MSNPSISDFLHPALCANSENEPCGTKDASFRCSGCNMVQYCSEICQKGDWPRHRKQCRSPFMKGTWVPEWSRQFRMPSFMAAASVEESERPLTYLLGQLKYPWGNMPALDILQVENNEGKLQAMIQNFDLLFVASGDLRNIIKTITKLPEGYSGECTVAANDMEFMVVARNAIMLLIAIKFEPEVATPLITHLWYSALLPSCMIHAVRAEIVPMIQQVCNATLPISEDQLHTHTFEVQDRKVCVTLKKDQWKRLALFCDAQEDLTAEKAQQIRRAILLAPDHIDDRDRGRLMKPANVRQGESRFWNTGILLPYGCSTRHFDTPNPLLFPENEWPTREDASPRQGWLHDEYMQFAPIAKADEFGAVFFHVQHLLLRFCKQLRISKVSFRLLNMDVREIQNNLDGISFDRIEISNICDDYYLGLPKCIEIFSSLLKERSQNPHATLLMLSMNVVREITLFDPPLVQPSLKLDMELFERYSPVDTSKLHMKLLLYNKSPHPDFLLRAYERTLFGPWDEYSDGWLEFREAYRVAHECGVAIKPTTKHTIIGPWPYRLSEDSTKEEFEVRRASNIFGSERYLEVHRPNNEGKEADSDDSGP